MHWLSSSPVSNTSSLPLPHTLNSDEHPARQQDSFAQAASIVQVGPRGAEGVIRSELQPEETSGLARSGDISRMLPMEAHLLAQGWAARAAMTAAGLAASRLLGCWLLGDLGV